MNYEREGKEDVISLHSKISLHALNGAYRTSALLTLPNRTE